MGNKFNIPDQYDELVDTENEMLDEDIFDEIIEDEDGDESLLITTIPEADLKNCSSVTQYINQIRKFKFLSIEEQNQLWEEGTQEAREKIINSHLPLVINLVYKLAGFTSRSEHDIVDLIQAGNQGLVIAATRFDPLKGNKFITYATYWIRVEISRELANQMNSGMRKTSYVVSGIKTISRTEELLESLLGRTPSKGEVVAALTGVMGEQRINNLYDAKQCGIPLSLDYRIENDDDDTCLGDYVSDMAGSDVAAELDEQERHQILVDAMRKVLTERERIILEATFGLGEFNGEMYTGCEIAKILKDRGITKKVVSKQMINHDKLQALDKLRAIPAIAELYACERGN